MVVVVRTQLTTIVREGIVMAYALFPPQGSVISPEAFRIERVRCLTRDNRFMHEYSFNAVRFFFHPFTYCTESPNRMGH
jgi:hypothetical protein